MASDWDWSVIYIRAGDGAVVRLSAGLKDPLCIEV